ncbi:MAG TPA: hypothetical protein VFA98_01945 [Thermoanaerobaculia bacterium]|jgi:hypothetical protein|nr:hypothetical protein [Thermoanaerobaculia bacterium]
MKISRSIAPVAFVALSFTAAGTATAQESDQITAADLANASAHSSVVTPHAHLNGQAHARHGIASIDSLVNFNGHYFADGFTSDGTFNTHWYFNTVGNPPQMHGTTMLNAPIVPVTLDLRNADGSPRFVNGQPLISRPDAFVTPTLNSPVFEDSDFSSSPVPTQFTDAVQRAEYFTQEKDDWHTLLAPGVKTGRTMVLNRGTYFFALNADGSCCEFVLIDADTFVNALFPATADDTTTPVGAAENAGDITTKDMSTFLFPNAYLFIGSVSNCCILGFHTYDFEPGDDSNGNVEKRYVLNYSSWISPGLFNGGFEDVTALSHEIAETYNDPFVASDGVHDVTPWWLAPNGNCQNDLETGDVIEGLPNGVFPITMNGMTYHPQNEALLQWFEFESPSSAIDGAYSYPNEQTLTSLSPPQNPGCH